MMLYHYCSSSTFESILDSKVLWMTDFTKSNDIQEITITYRKLWESTKAKLLACSDLDMDIVSKTAEIVDHEFGLQQLIDLPFGVCFCAHGDLLQQWLEYGDKTRGICLGFEFDWFTGIQKETRSSPSVRSHKP